MIQLTTAAALDDRAGDYYGTTEARSVAPKSAGTLDELATYLTDGYWSRKHFDTSGDNTISVNIAALTLEGQQLARWAFEAWEMVADIDFVEIEGSADISFDDDDPGAGASLAFTGGLITGAEVNVNVGWLSEPWGGSGIDSFSFSTYVHEIGHALGLGHPGPYNGSNVSYADALFSNDSFQISVMSYLWQDENPTINASDALPLTAMMADIVAIQTLYGAPDASSATAGNTVWGAGSTLGGYLGAYFAFMTDGSGSENFDQYYPPALTLYDRGGTDLIDLSFSTMNNRLDLNAGRFSDIEGGIGNIGIARDTLIENATMGSGDDTVMGNAARNLIDGGAGNDSLSGGSGADTLRGGYGNDTLKGGDGGDTLSGGEGDDLIFGGATAADRRDVIYAGAGNDSVDGGYGNDDLHGGTGNDTMAGGYGADTVIGNQGDDFLTGGVYADQIFGGDGFDFINGGYGNDLLNGGAGGDRFFHSGIAGHGSDWIQDLSAAEGDRLHYGGAGATRDQFQVNFASSNSGDANIDEAFVIYRPTGQILWAVVDGAAQDSLEILIGGEVYDLMI